MTRNEESAQLPPGELDERQRRGMIRLLPKVTFGLSAAVLAGVVVVTVPAAPSAVGEAAPQVMTTAGLGAVINVVTGSAARETTCCG
jgi:hypothetical protein